MENVTKYFHLSKPSLRENNDTFNKDRILSSPSLKHCLTFKQVGQAGYSTEVKQHVFSLCGGMYTTIEN